MINYIPNVWGWYLKRSPWIKWALFIFVIIIIAVLAIVYLFFPDKRGRTILDGDTTARVVDIEKKYEENLKETTKLDAELAHKILAEEEKRAEIEKEREEFKKKAKKAHDEIDRADDFDSIDRTLDGYITRTLPGKQNGDS